LEQRNDDMVCVCALVCIDEHDWAVYCCCRQVWPCTLYSLCSQVETIWQRDTGMFCSCPVQSNFLRMDAVIADTQLIQTFL